jgi:hypothetical protein
MRGKPAPEEKRCQGVKADEKRCENVGGYIGRDVYGKLWRLCGAHYRRARALYEVAPI